jgi:hypothetical protein
LSSADPLLDQILQKFGSVPAFFEYDVLKIRTVLIFEPQKQTFLNLRVPGKGKGKSEAPYDVRGQEALREGVLVQERAESLAGESIQQYRCTGDSCMPTHQRQPFWP